MAGRLSARRRGAAVTLAVLLIAATGPGEGRAAGPWRADASNTAGWEGMTPAERVEHQRRMRGFRSLDECAAYQVAQRKRVRERAGRDGRARREAPADGCAELQARGRVR